MSLIFSTLNKKKNFVKVRIYILFSWKCLVFLITSETINYLMQAKKGDKKERLSVIVGIQFEEFQPPEMEVIAQHFPHLF